MSAEALVLAPKTQAQTDALCSTEPELLYSGRKFAGKSWVAIVKAWGYAESYTKARCLVAREERRSMDNTTLEVAREVVPPEIWSACWSESKSQLRLRNGSAIDFLGLDEPDRMQGSRYGFIGIDQAEQISFRQFELANSCVGQRSMPWHQILLAVNPDTPAHWAYRRYLPDLGSGVRTRDGKTFARVVRVGREDLRDVMPPAYWERLSRLSGVRRRQLVDGDWCAHEGLVFGTAWDAQRMAGVAPPQAWAAWSGFPPPDWDRLRGIDFGFDHPAVCLWLACEPGSDRLWLYRQHYRSGLSPRQNALTIKALELRELNALRATCPDEPSARALAPYLAELNVTESWADHDRGERETYDEDGIWTTPADKDVLAGIGTLADAMARGNIVTVAGNLAERDERLAGLEEPTCLEEEIPLYHRPGSGDEEGGLAKKEIPIKERDHAIDALRYVAHSRSGARAVRVYA
jgi:phage terminase large subunit